MFDGHNFPNIKTEETLYLSTFENIIKPEINEGFKSQTHLSNGFIIAAWEERKSSFSKLDLCLVHRLVYVLCAYTAFLYQCNPHMLLL